MHARTHTPPAIAMLQVFKAIEQNLDKAKLRKFQCEGFIHEDKLRALGCGDGSTGLYEQKCGCGSQEKGTVFGGGGWGLLLGQRVPSTGPPPGRPARDPGLMLLS